MQSASSSAFGSGPPWGGGCAQPLQPGRAAMLSKGKRPYDPEVLEPRRRLRRNIEDLVANNALSSDRTAEIARDINGCDSASFPDVARRCKPGKVKNTARNLRKLFSKKSTWMPVYWAKVRCYDVKACCIKEEWLAINLIHEIVHVLVKQGILEKIMETEGMDPLTLEHLRACELEAVCELLGLGIWADGTPCNWDRSESVETLSLSLPGLTGEFRNLRIPITALGNKHCCKETWEDICKILKWSLQILATGQWPTCRHDGTPWRKSDCKRKAPRPLQRAALVEVRADWDWMAKVYGFPAHNFLAGCCWKCTCTPAEVTGRP
jgi:hypothetical protein